MKTHLKKVILVTGIVFLRVFEENRLQEQRKKGSEKSGKE